MTMHVPRPLRKVTGLPNTSTDSQIKMARFTVLHTLEHRNTQCEQNRNMFKVQREMLLVTKRHSLTGIYKLYFLKVDYTWLIKMPIYFAPGHLPHLPH